MTELAPRRAGRCIQGSSAPSKPQHAMPDTKFQKQTTEPGTQLQSAAGPHSSHSHRGGRTHPCHVKWVLSLFSTLQGNLNWTLAYCFLLLSSNTWMLTPVLTGIFMDYSLQIILPWPVQKVRTIKKNNNLKKSTRLENHHYHWHNPSTY